MTRRLPALLLVLALAACGGDGGTGPGATPDPGPDPTDYFPLWRDATPTATLTLEHDPLLSDLENGAALAAAIGALVPGQRLEVGGGTWSMQEPLDIAGVGSLEEPIVIAAIAGETPVLTRPDASHDVVSVGLSGPARYVAIRGLEITGGASLLNLHDAWNIWIDGCYLHDGQGDGIIAETANTDRLYITRNTIERVNPGQAGECVALGSISGGLITGNSIVALNRLHGIGLEYSRGIIIRQGSYNCLIARNEITGMTTRGIGVSPNGGLDRHRVERNLVYQGAGEGIYVASDARVENNIVAGTGLWALNAGSIGAPARNVELVHNTLVTTAGSSPLRLGLWNNGSGLVLSNNAIYCDGGDAITTLGGVDGVTVTGNVHFGGIPEGFPGTTAGNGFPDFVDLAPDGSALDATPSSGSPLLGAGAPAWAATYEFDGSARTGEPDAGAVQR